MDSNPFLKPRSVEVLSALVVTGVIICISWWIKRKEKKADPTLLVGRVSRIMFHPMKSMGTVEMKEAECTPMGLQYPGTNIRDRTFLVTNREYNFINLKQKPSLALVKPSIHGDEIHLDAPDMETLVVRTTSGAEPDCTVKVLGQAKSAKDLGDEAGEWLSRYLKQEGVRLSQSVPGPIRRIIRDDPRKPYNTYFKLPQVKQEDQVHFPDVSPFMFCSESSLNELNSRADVPVNMGYFRPSIVVEGAPPFDEDTWKQAKIGDAKFSFFMPNDSCTATQVNPTTGCRREDQEPLKTLRTFRMVVPIYEKPVFGQHSVLDTPGIIRVGDPVYVSKA